MLHKDVIAIDAEIDRLLQAAFCDNNIIQCVAFPAIMSQYTGIQQHPIVQTELALCHGCQLRFHFTDLAGSQKTAAAKIDAEDRLCILQRQIGFVQDRSVPADGQDHISPFQACFLWQVEDSYGTAVCSHHLTHQNICPMRQQDLSSPERDLVSRRFAGIRRNIDRHAASPFFLRCQFNGQGCYGLPQRPALQRCHPELPVLCSSARTSDTQCCPPDLSRG